MPPPTGTATPPTGARTRRWQDHIDVLRRHEAADPSAYSSAAGALELEMTTSGRSSCSGYRQRLGSAKFDDVVRDVIHGERRKLAPDPNPGAPLTPLPVRTAATAASALEDPNWRPGVMAWFEWADPVRYPGAFFDVCLERRLIEAKREADKYSSPTQSAEGDAEGAEPDDERFGSTRALSAVLDEASAEELLLAIPRAVMRTLNDAAAYGQVFLAIQSQLPTEQRVGAGKRQLEKSLLKWATLSSFLAVDIALRAKRRRWARLGNATDLSARAWQAIYYEYEEMDYDPGAKAGWYTEPTELPGTLPGSGQWYQHLSRFRRDYNEAASTTETIVAVGQAVPRVAAPEKPGGRMRLPAEWDAAEHPTLLQPHKKKADAAKPAAKKAGKA